MPVHENGRRFFHSSGQSPFLIGLNALPDFFTFDISFETRKIESNQAGVSIKEAVDFGCDAPFGLLRVQQIVHFPKLALQSRGFRDQCGLSRVYVYRQRKVSKNDFQIRPKLFFHLVEDT